jgi:hypothetical protein
MIAISHNGIPIRLPKERWNHIIDRHAILDGQQQLILDTLEHPTRILLGNDSALLAIREMEPNRWLVVVYREDENDGFVITAFPTRRIHSLNQRQQIWP